MALSSQEAVSDGTLATLAVSLEYFNRSEITVTFDGVVTAEGAGWVWVGTTDKQINFSPNVPNGVVVKLQRRTAVTTERHSFSEGAAFKATTLDENFEQIIRVAQEQQEGVYTPTDVLNNIDMHGFTLNNLPNAVLPGQPVTLAQVQAADSGAVLATLADTGGAALVGSDDSASGTLWTTVQGFINKLLSSTGSAVIGFVQTGAGAVARTIRTKLMERPSVLDFGAVGDGVADDTGAMTAAHATGKVIYYPEGTYLFSTLSFAAGGITGDGAGKTRLHSSDAGAGDIITFTGTGSDTAAPLFCDFKLQALNTKASGAGLSFTPSSGTLSYARIDGVLIYNAPRSLEFNAADHWRVTNSILLNYTDAGIFVANTDNIDSGDSLIQGCLINTGQVAGNRYGIFQESSAGLRVIGNKILGGTGGYVLAYKGNTQSGPLILANNSIENVAGNAIYLGHTATYTGIFGGVVINGNEIAVCDEGIWTDTSGAFTLLTISGNYVDLNNATGIGCFVKADKFMVGNNTLMGGLEGLRVDAAATNGRVGKNLYQSNTTAIINGSATTYVETDIQSGIVNGVSHTTAFGNVFHGSVAVTFPVAFKLVPEVDCKAGGAAGVAGGFCAYPTNITTTGFTMNLIGAVSGSTNSNRWTAHGVL